jgi:hypothetical protein
MGSLQEHYGRAKLATTRDAIDGAENYVDNNSYLMNKNPDIVGN